MYSQWVKRASSFWAFRTPKLKIVLLLYYSPIQHYNLHFHYLLKRILLEWEIIMTKKNMMTKTKKWICVVQILERIRAPQKAHNFYLIPKYTLIDTFIVVIILQFIHLSFHHTLDTIQDECKRHWINSHSTSDIPFIWNIKET